jgi:hypothetical protein
VKWLATVRSSLIASKLTKTQWIALSTNMASQTIGRQLHAAELSTSATQSVKDVNGDDMDEADARHFVIDLIMHGRHFNPQRDAVVIEKAVAYLTGKPLQTPKPTFQPKWWKK